MWSTRELNGEEDSLIAPQLVSYRNNDDMTIHLIFGAWRDGNIYSFDSSTSKLSLFDKYPNNFKPKRHSIQLYYNKTSQSYHVLSFGGWREKSQHFYSYNIFSKKWKNLQKKINKNNNIFIYSCSKSSLCNNNNNVIITTMTGKGGDNIIYIYSLYNEKIIKIITSNNISFKEVPCGFVAR